MTEYEMAELVNSGTANMLTGQAVYFTQLASYLVVAYVVGAKLTRFQVSFLSGLLILLTIVGMGNVADLLRKNLALIQELKEIGSVTVPQSDQQTAVILSVFIIFRIVILAGALLFMWQVRHPKTE